jgi:hypothetical protein
VLLFLTSFPIWGTKNPRADFLFLTRPLRPQLNSQSSYLDCADRQQLCCNFFWPGCLQQQKHFINLEAGVNSFFYFFRENLLRLTASTSKLTKNVLENYQKRKLAQEIFEKKCSLDF